MPLIRMQNLLLKTLVRYCLNERVSKHVIALVPLLLQNDSYVKGYDYAKFSTSTGEFDNLAEGLSKQIQLVVNKVSVGSSEEEILSSLLNDQICEGISVSHALVDMLLHRFRDDWKSAYAVFRWADSRSCFEHLPGAYDLMVDILGKARQFDKMSELKGEMLERKLVTLRTMSKIMRRFAGARRWNDAVRTFDELPTYGLEKNAESMNLLLDTLCKESQVQMARGIFLDLKSHIPPTVHIFNIFIHGWCKIKRVEEAYWTLQEMKGHGFTPCVISYTVIIQSYCRLSNWNKAYELLEMMESEGCQPSVVTYTTMMSLLSKADKVEDALQIANQAKSAGCEFDIQFYNALIHTLGKAQRITEAFDIFKVEMPMNGVHPNTCTYNTLIGMFCRHGQEEMAFNVLEDMEKAALCKPDLQTFYPLLKSCFRLRMPDNCLSRLLDDMTVKHQLSLDDSTYSLLIHGLCRVDRCDWAFQLFEEMICKELVPRHQTFRRLLDEVRQKNMYDAAERVELHFDKFKASFRQSFPAGSRGSNVSI
ncbi:pentatricopeptide repeat-containing protein At3g04130, mitochondrial-like isoform X1 [Chenopodium quinoa]|uniref:pentatricopeptide repeat-containing protein At3g04130, mitochondrial-like isoform X1 n=1 Tax=Chenopodium quinoa TaxID=63459 RepID=UPI000B784D3F|nr:pentatricopeptide repeat-containing protein At3g04130, mitochondrial-like isoform X1 [Chenopodium quinoa]XP_021746534.1 pentatricopeptide repeat-containing protein At3g04130, mitochondrial-like isoform X1 [Chenopodium quinoa]